MNINLSEVGRRTVSANEYIEKLGKPFKENFLARKQSYMLNQKAVDRLKMFARDYMIVVFSAKWCKDCVSNIPVLALISEATGLEVRIFEGLIKDPLSHTRKWRIPPSPPEVETFGVDKIPLILLFDKIGKEVGRIAENPQRKATWEEEILEIILERHQ